MSKEKLKSAVKDYVKYSKMVKFAQKKANSVKPIITKYLSSTGKKIRYDNSVCYCITKTIINYDIPKIKKIFGKLAKKFIDAKASINDFDLFLNICRENGVDVSIFKPVLSVSYSVNEDKLNNLIDRGKISYEKLGGCYEVTETKTVGLRIH